MSLILDLRANLALILPYGLYSAIKISIKLLDPKPIIYPRRMILF